MQHPFPEPEYGDVPVWRHSGHDPMPRIKLASDPLVKKINIAFYLLFLFGAWYWFTRPSVLEYLVSVRFLGEIVIGFLLFYLGPKLIAQITKPFEKDGKPNSTAIPLWMSKDRLAYSTADEIIDRTLNLSDILAVTPDFAEGAPALALSLQDRTIILISSEITNLQTKLFSLRPDLKPTP